jgi:6-phosphogluconolactonase
MAYYLYVSIMKEEKVNVYGMDGATGALDLKHEVPLTGGPAGIAIHPNKRFLYVVRRGASQLASFAMAASDGSLTHLGTIEEASDSVYITIDGAGKFVLTSSNSGSARSYRVGEDGALVAPAASTVYSLPGSHSVQVHPSNKYVYVPHCITQNAIFQHKYDGETGQITPQELAVLVPPERLGPRHIRFHPTLDVLYTTDEQGNSISAYRVNLDGRLSPSFQTISTLPDDFEPSDNTTAQLRVHSSGRFLYAPNRGHDSIACFKIDAGDGALTLIGRVPTEPHVRGFDIDPQGRFIFAAGVDSGKVSAYIINQGSGELSHIDTYDVGENPMWILATQL